MIQEKYQELLTTSSDIQTHLQHIKETVQEGDTVVEMGVRDCVSTWALLAARPRQLTSIDVVLPKRENLEVVVNAAQEESIDFIFHVADSTHFIMEPVDILFIDTIHTYSQLVKELWRHAENTKKYIILHDANIPEMAACIQDFLYNPHWKLHKWVETQTGLAILKRV